MTAPHQNTKSILLVDLCEVRHGRPVRRAPKLAGEARASNETPVAALRLATVGRLLFGERFHSALAVELDVSRPMVWAMVNGQRRVSPEVERRLATAIRARQIPRLEEAIRALASTAEVIENKLEAYELNPGS